MRALPITGLLILPWTLQAFHGVSLSVDRGRRSIDPSFVRSKLWGPTATAIHAPGHSFFMSSGQEPSIAIVGCGAVGSYYGARLWEAGVYNVKFHMRGEHFRASTMNGLNVTSIHEDIFVPPEALEAFETTDEIGPVDWVVVALKSSSLQVIPKLIFPLLHERTRVVTVMNGLIEEDLVASLNQYAGAATTDDGSRVTCCAAVYGGMALICSNRLAPGQVEHSYAGLLSGGLAASSPGVEIAESKEAFEKLWEPTKVEISYEESLRRGRWKKCVWNLPYNGISVAMGGITVDKIVNDPGLRRLADLIMDETVAIANADLTAHDEAPSMLLGEKEKMLMRDLSDNMGPYKTSTMLDLTMRKPMEVEYMFRKPIEKAESLGVPVPHLETIVAQIEAMQRAYGLF